MPSFTSTGWWRNTSGELTWKAGTANLFPCEREKGLTKSENRKTGGKNRYFAPCVSFAFASHFCPTLSVVVAARGTEP
jgi:hypothetical protein